MVVLDHLVGFKILIQHKSADFHNVEETRRERETRGGEAETSRDAQIVAN